MTSQQPPYIVPIITPKGSGSQFAGTGFIVGNYLITAAHVVAHWAGFGLAAVIDGNEVGLGLFSQKLNIGPDKESDSFDLAVFSIGSNVDSPLSLADDEPSYDDNNAIVMVNKHLQPEGDGDAYYRECECQITQQSPEMHFGFEGDFKDEIEPGASGSPLIKDNVVYGMVVDAYVDKDSVVGNTWIGSIFPNSNKTRIYSHKLVFLKASEIKKRMSEAGLI